MPKYQHWHANVIITVPVLRFGVSISHCHDNIVPCSFVLDDDEILAVELEETQDTSYISLSLILYIFYFFVILSFKVPGI